MTVFDRLYASHTASSANKRKTGAAPVHTGGTCDHSAATGAAMAIGGASTMTTATHSSSSSTTATPPPIKSQLTDQSPGSPTGGEDLTEQTEQDEDDALLAHVLQDEAAEKSA